ncbi:terpenoid synthase [Colletotrichum scovillei]|uniref:Terpenoid synthase n=1 Tax=Colletotrichum scovillei TaxID=1209932 RepID=A0A9P7R305_9PEZI|nr:terpenoid synthase [Colletotrichum scovillei]KAG7065717.1 terpenoid synthase [Colletotrichum scovillei]KAG7068319.1 terpenoid synthase [Colletotrichum scovillei]
MSVLALGLLFIKTINVVLVDDDVDAETQQRVHRGNLQKVGADGAVDEEERHARENTDSPAPDGDVPLPARHAVVSPHLPVRPRSPERHLVAHAVEVVCETVHEEVPRVERAAHGVAAVAGRDVGCHADAHPHLVILVSVPILPNLLRVPKRADHGGRLPPHLGLALLRVVHVVRELVNDEEVEHDERGEEDVARGLVGVDYACYLGEVAGDDLGDEEFVDALVDGVWLGVAVAVASQPAFGFGLDVLGVWVVVWGIRGRPAWVLAPVC